MKCWALSPTPWSLSPPLESELLDRPCAGPACDDLLCAKEAQFLPSSVILSTNFQFVGLM